MAGTIYLSIPSKLERDFVSRAKAAYPREAYAYLLGILAGDHVHIEDLYIPEGADRYATDERVNVLDHWIVEALEAAREEDLTVVGDIHSHPYPLQEADGRRLDCSQSEADIDRPRLLIAGVCVVQQIKWRGKVTLRASIRYWGPTLRIQRIPE